MMGQTDELVLRIFVGAFRPDRFILFELHGDRCLRDGDDLTGAGAKVHFDAVSSFIEESGVRKLLKVEIGAEFAIDAGKKVEIKGGGNPDGIVVGGNQCWNGLQHVGAKKERVAWQKNLAQVAQKFGASGAIEVADVAAKEKSEQMLAGGAAGCDFAEAVKKLALEADDADAVDVAKLAVKEGECGRRDFDGVIPGGLPAGQRLQEQARFAAGAAAEFRDDDGPRKLVDDFASVNFKQVFLGAREAIFREF